jgi:hypothetical protein
VQAALETTDAGTVEPGSELHRWAMRQADALLGDDCVRGYAAGAGSATLDLPWYDPVDHRWHHADGSTALEPRVGAVSVAARAARRGPRRPVPAPAPVAANAAVGEDRSHRPYLPLALEQSAAIEFAELMLDPLYLGAGVPRGTGQSVLLVPGFMGSDAYLTVMGGWLRRVGYRPSYAGIALNAGSLPALLGVVERRAERLARPGRRIAIVGHSLGGIFARILGARRPDLVARVITLGAPIVGDPARVAHPLVQAVAQALLCRADLGQWARDDLARPLPDAVRLTCIYSRQDAIVDWRACLAPEERAANVEVAGSHIGLTWNAAVYRAIARTLVS